MSEKPTQKISVILEREEVDLMQGEPEERE